MKREEQLKANAEQIILGYYLNMESNEELMNESELIEYVLKTVYDIKSNGYEQVGQSKGICADLKFLGREKTQSIILELGRKHEVLK